MGKMNASVLSGVRSLARVEQVDIPEIGPDDALVLLNVQNRAYYADTKQSVP